MKKTMLFSSALVALAMLASCQKEQPIETPATATGVTEFTATIESTKTVIGSDGKVTWEKDDKITVTDAESKSADYVAASSGATTTFTLMTGQTAVGSGPYTATYGDITKQVYDANGANCPLEANTADAGSTTLHFSSPYAVLKITAKSSDGEKIKKVVVEYGNSSSILDCDEEVKLTSSGVDFYVAVRPATNAALSVSFYTADKMATKTRMEPISLAAKDLLSVTFESLTWEDVKTFKAVYNSTNTTLTFYYDNVDHSGDGITVYEDGTANWLFDSSKTNNNKWGYSSNVANIKNVVINASVAGYEGLRKTTYMFNLPLATSISGAEYLDVSNVTDMSNMFNNFGGMQSGLNFNEVPDVSRWNTINVTDMSNMFKNYGQKSTNLNEVPDVSNWNTVSVTDMNNMFSNYGSSSTVLDKVPDVNLWNTGKVVNMSLMFSNYGQKSTKLTEVPDVSKWNTGSVTNMSQMFEYYGITSKELAKVPEVTQWNTENVEDWSSIFNSYGSSSTALTKVPNVSGWKTNNVKEIDNMFNGYGSSSSNIDCVLDLSGWDLSKLSQGGNAFEFKPKTFNVTIPAKTGEIYNQGQKWSYGVYNFFIKPALKPGNWDERYSFTLAGVPADAITGVFSVSESKKVRFSRGNLWYGPKTTGASSTFNFETNQYDISSSWNESHVSNFYWSQTASSAYATTYDNAGSTTDVLFTNATETEPNTSFTVNGMTGVWRTLSQTEWQYLLANHTYKYVPVNGRYGIVIAPDGFSGTIVDSYDASDWATAEAAGLVFMPSTGYRNSTFIEEVSGDKISCIYWTSTADSDDYDNAYRMFFQWDDSKLITNFNDNNSRKWAVGIRLVTDIK